MLSMTPEERAKQELIMKNREEYIAKRKQETDYKKQLEEASMKDRAVRA
jgi:signal recognition particle GTPase